jgi:phosphoglycerol geranylgeranyltransferase
LLKALLKKFNEKNECGFALLLDPDKLVNQDLDQIIRRSVELGVDCFLIGSSILLNSDFDLFVQRVKKLSDKTPVYIFPGNGMQVSAYADGILFMSLISGRNPDFLISQQVLAAPSVYRSGIETIATAYLLIESGKTTSVEFMSNTKPIPRDKHDIALAHALAAKFLGFECIYLEAGSGAETSVSDKLIKLVKESCKVPLIVGGGIKSVETIKEKVHSGANLIVCGNFFEETAYHFDTMHKMILACKEKQ